MRVGMSTCVYTYTCIANATHVACSWSTMKRSRFSGGRAAKRQSPCVNLLQFFGPSHGNRLACSTLYIPVARPNANETPPCVYLCTHVCRITQCHGSGSANTSEAGSSSSLNQEPTRSQSPSSSSRYVLRNVWLLQGS